MAIERSKAFKGEIIPYDKIMLPASIVSEKEYYETEIKRLTEEIKELQTAKNFLEYCSTECKKRLGRKVTFVFCQSEIKNGKCLRRCEEYRKLRHKLFNYL